MTKLMGGNRVHVTLDDDDLIVPADRLLSQVESEEEGALVEYHGLGRVEILWHRVAKCTTTEANHATLPRANGEEEAVAEPVAVAAAVSLGEKSRFHRQRGIDSALMQIAAERITVGGEAQAEPLRDLSRDAALREQVATGGSRRGVAQHVGVIRRGQLIQLDQPVAMSVDLRRQTRRIDQLDPGALGQLL